MIRIMRMMSRKKTTTHTTMMIMTRRLRPPPWLEATRNQQRTHTTITERINEITNAKKEALQA
jgi:hypothetical protein